MMQNYQSGIKDKTIDIYQNKRNKRQLLPVSDTIYTLDIETTNLFKIDGEWRTFDYDIKSYSDIPKASVCWIWMFGIEDSVYYGREFRELNTIFKEISDPNLTKIIYIHNLSFEFGWLLNIITENNYTIEDMCCRTVKKPIQFKIKELNIIFRCSYMLTNLSLEIASKEYTTLAKKTGDLDYNITRSPLTTTVSDKELGYCEYDILCLYEIVKHFRNEYEHLYNIPLTSTGIVRKALRDRLGFFYIRKQQELVPDASLYLKLWSAFSGGFTHANILNSNRIIKNVESEDIASDYPNILCVEKFPCKPFIRCKPKQFFNSKHRQEYAFLVKLELQDIKSNYYNHYLQHSKIYDPKGAIVDNGRIVSLKSGSLWCTDIDYDIIRKNYRGDIKVIDCYKSVKKYLDVNIIKFILELYRNKTTLKGIKEKESIYKRDKSMLNSIFGMSVTNPLKQSAEFSSFGYWQHKDFSPEFIEEKLEDMKKSYSTLFFYAVGVWVTAYARCNLFSVILSSHDMDRDIIYCDTDSIKFKNREKHQDIFLTYNNDMIEKYRSVCEYYDELEIKDFMPTDKNGVLHPLGFFEFDGFYKQFKTLGAKKYCYTEDDGKLHITVAGVSKKGVYALDNNIDNFRKGFIWDYKASDKLSVLYHELVYSDDGIIDNLQEEFNFTDIDGNIYHSDYKYSVVLFPTTYTLGINDIYEALINDYYFIRSGAK